MSSTVTGMKEICGTNKKEFCQLFTAAAAEVFSKYRGARFISGKKVMQEIADRLGIDLNDSDESYTFMLW